MSAITLVPNGEKVSITLGGVTQTAAVAGGVFASGFNTAARSQPRIRRTRSPSLTPAMPTSPRPAARSELYVDPCLWCQRNRPQSGNVTIGYSLTDAESSVYSVAVQYSTNGGGTWHAATPVAGGSGTSKLASSPAGTAHTFVWNTAADLGDVKNSDVELRIVPTNTWGTSAASATNASTVNNYVAPPTVTSISPADGLPAGGSMVTIVGTNLANATVRFGTKAVLVTSDSATKIVVISPSGAGTVPVTVTTAGGTSAVSAADQFTYLKIGIPPLTPPVVTGMSPSFGYASGGTKVTIVGTGLANVKAVKFGTPRRDHHQRHGHANRGRDPRLGRKPGECDR